ncbi:MAG: phosphoribosylglycinamide formyltransferase [Pseudomonadales bacterium]|nr:phosphoribosylglycinamide formyltransferase [Halioglobus sp.]MCP5131736.1 phosphoribosylglycinamide formyltransferase [Pseudomonadales bacterium]
MTAARARLAILISGRGSNLQAFIDACASGRLAAEICVVISNNPEAEGLRKAADAGIATRCIDHRDYATREEFDAVLAREVSDYRADLVILAGFMRILTPTFIEPFSGRLLNVHPSLLPKYPGLHTHQRALDAGDSEAGVTVHYVTLELDGGPPIIQARVPILPQDTAQTLAARVIVNEHIIYPLAAQWHISGRLRLTESGVCLDGKSVPSTGVDYRQEED